jgi:hypothetical protein
MSNARRIDSDERDRITSRLEKMLARHVVAMPCPLSTEAYGRFVEAALPEIPRRAWHAMRNWWMLDPKEKPPYKSQEHIGIPIVLPYGEQLLLQISEDELDPGQYPLFRHENKITEFVDINIALWGEERQAFVDWAYVAVKITARARESSHTLSEILELAGTVGQLHRMCPDLVRYTYSMTQEALARQERRSPLPDGWMNINRRKIHDMLEHLALCHLLPENTAVNTFTQYVNEEPWVFDRAAMGFANYHATADTDQRKYFSMYQLETDRFVTLQP